MSRLSSVPLLFGLSAILLVGLLFGGVWYAVKYNDDQAHNNVVAESEGQSSQVLPGDEEKPPADNKQTEDKKPAQDTQKPPAAPSKPPTPAPTPKPAQPAPSKSTPPVVATTGPTHIPAAGMDTPGIIATGLLITVAVFLVIRLRRQRLQLRALR